MRKENPPRSYRAKGIYGTSATQGDSSITYFNNPIYIAHGSTSNSWKEINLASYIPENSKKVYLTINADSENGCLLSVWFTNSVPTPPSFQTGGGIAMSGGIAMNCPYPITLRVNNGAPMGALFVELPVINRKIYYWCSGDGRWPSRVYLLGYGL